MISGYAIGTEVKWNENNALTTGTVEHVYYESQTIELKNRLYDVEVSSESPTYLIRRHDGEFIILPHDEITLHHSNSHT